MSDADSRLSDAADRAEAGADIIEQVANGGDTVEVPTASGPRPSLAKWFADRYAEFYAWAALILADCLEALGLAQAALAETVAAKNAAESALVGAEAARDVALTAGFIYESAAAGEAVRSEGEYFWVVSAEDTLVLELWLMGEAAATDTGKRTINKLALDATKLNSERSRFHVYGDVTRFQHLNDLSAKVSWGALQLYVGSTGSNIVIAPVTNLIIPNGQAAYIDLNAALNGSGQLVVTVGNVRAANAENPWVSSGRIILLEVFGTNIAGRLQHSVAQYTASKAAAFIKGGIAALKWDAPNSRVLLTTPTLVLQINGNERIIDAVTDLVIPGGGCAYVDLNDDVLTLKVSANDVSATTNDSRFPFSKDNLFVVLSVENVVLKRLGGPLATVSFIPRNHEQARICSVHGGVEFITQNDDQSGCFVKFSDLRLNVGAVGGTLLLENFNGTLLSEEALVVDLDDALVGGRQPVHKVSSGISSVANGDGGFISDNKVLLFYYGTARYQSGLLAEQFRSRNHNAMLGNVVVPDAGVQITFNPATRTLSWSGDLYFHTTATNSAFATNRIRLNAGSVTFDASSLQVAWLDLREATNGDTPASVVKIGKYFTGSNRFVCRDYQVPLFWFSAGQYDRIGGFPRPVVESPPQIASTDYMVVEQSANNLFIYRKGSNNSSNKWIRIDLQYLDDTANEVVDRRYNVWRIRRAFLATRNEETGAFTLGTDLTTLGEWECAIKEVGAGDFMGGQNHGNEFMQYATILADGKKLDPTATATFNVKRLELTQKTHLTQWGSNNAVHVANRIMRWDITSETMILSNRVEWLAALSIADSYLAMLPIYRERNGFQITDTGIRNPEWAEEDLELEGFTQVFTKANQARIWGNELGVSAEMEVVRGWELPNREFFFSGAPGYNKMYFDFSGGSYLTTIGEIWDTQTVYKLDISG